MDDLTFIGYILFIAPYMIICWYIRYLATGRWF